MDPESITNVLAVIKIHFECAICAQYQPPIHFIGGLLLAIYCNNSCLSSSPLVWIRNQPKQQNKSWKYKLWKIWNSIRNASSRRMECAESVCVRVRWHIPNARINACVPCLLNWVVDECLWWLCHVIYSYSLAWHFVCHKETLLGYWVKQRR